jgi:ankyrin repeat protein
VVLVGCGESQQSAPAPESKPVEPVAEAVKPEPPTAKAPDISIHTAIDEGNIEAVRQHLAAGVDVNAKKEFTGDTLLHYAGGKGHKGIAELLIAEGADVNAKNDGGFTPLHYAASRRDKEIAKDADVNAKMEDGDTPLDWAIEINRTETGNLLRKHGGKTSEELEAAGN